MALRAELLPADLVSSSDADIGVDLEGRLASLLVLRQRDGAGGGLRGGEPPGIVVLGRLGLVIEVAVTELRSRVVNAIKRPVSWDI
jgi:hypothetical protein